MFDFPAAPAINDEYTSGGTTYVWTGISWDLASGGSMTDYVLKEGDTMTGPLTMSATGITFAQNLAASAADCSKHLVLYDAAAGDYGLSVSSKRLNYNTDAIDSNHWFRTGDVDRVSISNVSVELYSTYVAIRPATGYDGQNMIHFRDSAGAGPAWLRGQGSSYEGGIRFHTRNGGWGWTDSFRSNCSSAGELYVNSDATAQAFTVRSSATTKHDIRDCADTEVHDAFAALKPKRFRRNLPPPPVDEDGKPLSNPWPYPAPRLQFGFILEEVAKTAADDVVTQEYVTGTEGKTFAPRGIDIMQVLALTVAKVKQLEAEIATLKAQPRGRR